MNTGPATRRNVTTWSPADPLGEIGTAAPRRNEHAGGPSEKCHRPADLGEMATAGDPGEMNANVRIHYLVDTWRRPMPHSRERFGDHRAYLINRD